MLRQKKLPTAKGVTAGETATFNLDLGVRYAVVWLQFADSDGVALADLTGDVRLKLNGNVQRTFTPIQADALYGLMGGGASGDAFKSQIEGTGAAAQVILPIWLCSPWRKTNAEVMATAWNANPANVSSFQIEVDLASGLSTPTLTGWYEYDDMTGQLGGITKWIRQNLPALGTENDFNELDKKEYIESIHLFPTVEATPKFIEKLKFTAGGRDVIDLIDYIQNRRKLYGRELVPDTSATPRFDLVFDYDDPIDNALLAQGLSEMTLHTEYNDTAAGNLPTIIQRTGPPV